MHPPGVAIGDHTGRRQERRWARVARLFDLGEHSEFASFSRGDWHRCLCYALEMRCAFPEWAAESLRTCPGLLQAITAVTSSFERSELRSGADSRRLRFRSEGERLFPGSARQSVLDTLASSVIPSRS